MFMKNIFLYPQFFEKMALEINTQIPNSVLAAVFWNFAIISKTTHRPICLLINKIVAYKICYKTAHMKNLAIFPLLRKYTKKTAEIKKR